MAKKSFYLQSTKAKGLRFKIIKLDKEKMMAVLQGDTGVPFDQSVSPENLKKFGYEVMQEVMQEVVPDDATVSAE